MPQSTDNTSSAGDGGLSPAAPVDSHGDRVDSDDDEEILEESPCGRWAKRREQVDQRDVPGIDKAYLAMDTEEGVEVVWNEVFFAKKGQEVRSVFESLTRLSHPNIVKFHQWWTDQTNQRIVFITEYMSSGSLKQFLKRTKKNGKKLPLAAWKRWSTQILSALSYLHSCNPPIIHGNLTCDTIFIQHNGLVKIGSVAPDAIHHHVKSVRDNIKNMHFVAPEVGIGPVTPAADIYAFGMCALEMAALEIQGNGDSGTLVTKDHIQRTIESLDPDESPIIDFVRACIQEDPTKRPTERQLLFHPVIFEVPSLKLMAASVLVNCSDRKSESINERLQRHNDPETVFAQIVRKRRDSDPPDPNEPLICFPFRLADVTVTEKLEKFLEDVKFGIYPMTCFEIPGSCPAPSPTPDNTAIDSVKSTSPEPTVLEQRRAISMMIRLRQREEGPGYSMTVLVRMEDKMNRQLNCIVSESDSADTLTDELIMHGFLHEDDREQMQTMIQEHLSKKALETVPSSPDSNQSTLVPSNVSNAYPPLPQF